jgi:hypothetical protein
MAHISCLYLVLRFSLKVLYFLISWKQHRENSVSLLSPDSPAKSYTYNTQNNTTEPTSQMSYTRIVSIFHTTVYQSVSPDSPPKSYTSITARQETKNDRYHYDTQILPQSPILWLVTDKRIETQTYLTRLRFSLKVLYFG